MQSNLELGPPIDDFLSNTRYSTVIDFQSRKDVRLKIRIRCFVTYLTRVFVLSRSAFDMNFSYKFVCRHLVVYRREVDLWWGKVTLW